MAEQAAKKLWYKRWWAITLFVLIGLSIIGKMLETSSSPNTFQTQNPITSDVTKLIDQKQSDTASPIIREVFSADPESLLPTREDVATEFWTGKVANISFKKKYAGLQVAKYNSFSKLDGTSGIIEVEFRIVTFDSQMNAQIFWNDIVSGIKQDGGYTEIDNPTRENCFTYTQDYGFDAHFGENFCIKQNVVFSTYVTTSNTFKKADVYVRDMGKMYGKRVGSSLP
jgi:hypothetical protein